MSLPKFKEPIVYCDIDDTLVSWKTYPKRGKNSIDFKCPFTGETLYLNVISSTVEALKNHKIRGHTIILWSSGGADWCEEVAKRLGLYPGIVDAVMSKPDWFYDDLPASEFMPEINRKIPGNSHDSTEF